ncbi:MAG: hypothetical protein IH616_09825 [Gemmatimonadales bacterium]|nr:hypothetical protein [Gemmatimonadales bacterium]
MRILVRALGSVAIGLAVIAVLLAIASWPPGGLFFAAPYFFLLIAVVLGAIGGIVVLLARPRRKSHADEGAA